MQSRSTSLSMGEYLQTVLNSILHETTATVQHYSMPVREYPRAWPCSFTKTLQHACTRVPTCVAMQLHQDTTACLYASTHVRGHAALPRHYSMPVREYPRAWPCSFTKTLQHACTRIPTCVAMQLYQDTTACLYASTHVRGHAALPRHYSMPVREYPRAWPCSFTKTLQHACTRVPTCVAMQLHQDILRLVYCTQMLGVNRVIGPH